MKEPWYDDGLDGIYAAGKVMLNSTKSIFRHEFCNKTWVTLFLVGWNYNYLVTKAVKSDSVTEEMLASECKFKTI